MPCPNTTFRAAQAAHRARFGGSKGKRKRLVLA